MFEEVPAHRRRYARLLARRVVLGPFVVGTGMLLAMLGCSAALAATVITASTIGLGGAPHSAPEAIPATTASQPSQSGEPTVTRSGVAGQPALTATTAASSAATGAASATSAVATGAPASPSATGSAASATPSGNAFVYVVGYDESSARLLYQYAAAAPASGSVDGLTYGVIDPDVYGASIGADIRVVSAGTICSPAGGDCTVEQLRQASHYFAEVAIDAKGVLHSLIERSDASSGFGSPTSPSPSASPSAPSSPDPTVSRRPTSAFAPSSPDAAQPTSGDDRHSDGSVEAGEPTAVSDADADAVATQPASG